MSAFFASVHRASSISNAIQGNFRGLNKRDMLVACYDRLDLYEINATPGQERLTLIGNTQIYSRIADLAAITQSRKDQVLILTDRLDCFIVFWDKSKFVNYTCISSKLESPMPFSSCGFPKVFFTRDFHSLAILQDNCIVTTISLLQTKQQGRNKQNSSSHQISMVRIAKGGILSAAMSKPKAPGVHKIDKMAFLCQDSESCKNILFYRVKSPSVELMYVPSMDTQVTESAHKLFSCSFGLLVLSETNIMLYDWRGIQLKSRETQTTSWSTMCEDYDGNVILSDERGNLYSLKSNLAFKSLFKTSLSTCLVCISSSILFVGSHFGDSQLINLDGTILEEFSNLAPILDFCLINEDSNECAIITCSGAYENGSLRKFKYGLQIANGTLISDLGPGSQVVDIFHVAIELSGKNCEIVVVCKAMSTKILHIDHEILEISDLLSALDFAAHTLLVFTNSFGFLSQITRKQMSLTRNGLELIDLKQLNISFASRQDDFVLVSSNKNCLTLFEFASSIVLLKECFKSDEISCISSHKNMFAIGYWNARFEIVLANSLDLLYSFTFQDSKLCAKSIALQDCEESKKFEVYISFFNGLISGFEIEIGSEKVDWKHSINKGGRGRPAKLAIVKDIQHQNCVLACTDSPALFRKKKSKTVYSNLNLQKVYCATQFAESVVFAIEEGLLIAPINIDSHLYIQTLKIGEIPKKIIHDQINDICFVLSIKLETANRPDFYSSFIRVYDPENLYEITSCYLNDNEFGVGLAFYHEYIIAATCSIQKDDSTKFSHVFIFSFDSSTKGLVLESKQTLEGSIHSISSSLDYIWIGLTSNIQLYKFDKNGSICVWNLLQSFQCPTLTIGICHIQDNTVLVMDMMRSVYILEFDAKFTIVCSDRKMIWTTAASEFNATKHLSDTKTKSSGGLSEYYLIAEAEEGVLGLCEAKFNGVKQFEWKSAIRLGEMINKIVNEPLLLNAEFADSQAIVATVYGSLYVIGRFKDQKDGHNLLKLQKKLVQQARGIGGKSQLEWRRPTTFMSQTISSDYQDFIDVDYLLEVIAEDPEFFNAIILQDQDLKGNQKAILELLDSISKALN